MGMFSGKWAAMAFKGVGKKAGSMFSGRGASWVGRHPKTTIGGFAALTATSGIGSNSWKSLTFSNERPGTPSTSYGPGYMSWGKRTGMPANHLSTQGLSLGLSKMRHTSTI